MPANHIDGCHLRSAGRSSAVSRVHVVVVDVHRVSEAGGLTGVWVSQCHCVPAELLQCSTSAFSICARVEDQSATRFCDWRFLQILMR